MEDRTSAIAFWVYCDQTLAVPKVCSSLNAINVEGTLLFLERVIKFWKIFSVKEMLCDGRLNDPLKRVISNECNQYLHFLYEFATTAKEMTAKQGFRVQPFARDTKLAIQLQRFIKFVKTFVKCWSWVCYVGRIHHCLRKCSRRKYLATVQNVIEKLPIEKAKAFL